MADDDDQSTAGVNTDTDAEAEAEADADGDTDPAVAIEHLLESVGFDPATSVLTRRQAEVLAFRERGLSQATIADRLGTSRANVSSVEGSARDNLEKAREAVAFAEALSAPVQVQIPVGTDLYDVPQQVYTACDEAGVKVSHTAPDLMKVISDGAGEGVHGREVSEPLLVGVTVDGDVRVRRSEGESV